MGPVLTGFDFFTEGAGRKPIPEIELSPDLIKAASQHANAGAVGAGNVYFKTHVDYLKRVLGIVIQGGSALLCSDLGQQVITTAEKYPAALFERLDEEWRRLAQSAQQTGLGLLVPPLLGIVLTRCARRDAIPIVIRDLRDEWAVTRRKIWALLEASRASRTSGEFMTIERELSQASRLFSPQETKLDSHPIRVF
jgi:antitoxin component of RelBE/YafQ-DinJ toxin-antitoxin module